MQKMLSTSWFYDEEDWTELFLCQDEISISQRCQKGNDIGYRQVDLWCIGTYICVHFCSICQKREIQVSIGVIQSLRKNCIGDWPLKVGDSAKLEGISESVGSCKTDVLATAEEEMVEEEEGSCSLSQRREGAKALSGIAEKIWRTYFCSYEPTDYVLHGEDCCIGCVENSWPCCFVYQQVWVFWMEVSTRHVIGMGKGTKTHLSEGWRWWDVWGGIARMMFSLTASWRRPRSSCEEWESRTRSWGRLGPLFGMNTCQNQISR